MIGLTHGDILDIGCNTGYYMRPLMEQGDAMGVDVSQEIIRIARENGFSNCYKGDIFKYKFSKKNLNLIIVLKKRSKLKIFERVDEKITSKNLVLFFFIGIAILNLIILFIHTKTPEILNLLSNISFFLIIYYTFTYISQNIINYDHLLFIFTKYSSIHSNLPFTQKDIKNITLGINLAAKLLLGLILFNLVINPLRYTFTFMHEISHTIVAIIYKIEISDFVINIGGTSYVELLFVPYGPKASNILIAGSMGAFLLGFFMILLILLKRGIKAEIFLPLFALISTAIIGSVEYWIWGAINGSGDAWDFLLNNPLIESFQLILACSILKNEVILFLIILFVLKTISIIRKRIYEIFPDFSQFIITND